MNCPKCGTIIKRNGWGAGYVENWDKLPVNCEKLLAWWLGSEYRDKQLTKEQIVKFSKLATIDSINARISELKALDLVCPVGDGSYVLVENHTIEILNRCGVLEKVEKENFSRGKII